MNTIESLTEILPYVRAFQDKTFVIKIGGEVCQGPLLDAIAQQVSLVHHIGIRVVLVHGGGVQLNTLLQKLGTSTKSISDATVSGRRITDEATLEAAKMVFAGQLATNVVSALRKHGSLALSLAGAAAGVIEAVKRPAQSTILASGEKEMVDFQFVGDIRTIRIELIENLLAQRIIPLFSPLAADESGQVYNINADTLAAKLAQALHVEKFVLMTNVPGILRTVSDQSSLISYLDINQVEQLITSGQLNGGMLPKVQACIDALMGGVPRTHIINGSRPGSLFLELFSNEGVGTMIVKRLAELEESAKG